MTLSPSIPGSIPRLQSSSTSPITLTGRGAITGMTRTGKTTLSRLILAPESKCLVIDPKWCFRPLSHWRGRRVFRRAEYSITWDPAAVAQLLGQGHVIYRPPVGDPFYDQVFAEAWESRIPHTLAVDETAMVCKSAVTYPAHLRAYWQQGGELGYKALAISQRPSCIGPFVFSESEQHWMFRMILKRDRERAAEWIGDEAMAGTSDLHSFFYRHVHDEAGAREYMLQIGAK